MDGCIAGGGNYSAHYFYHIKGGGQKMKHKKQKKRIQKVPSFNPKTKTLYL